MLAKPNPNDLTREDFILWLGTQKPERKYNFYNHCNCALAQYARARGFADATAGSTSVELGDNGTWVHIFSDLAEALPVIQSKTFGELHRRLEDANT